jgi:hypothetical protein
LQDEDNDAAEQSNHDQNEEIDQQPVIEVLDARDDDDVSQQKEEVDETPADGSRHVETSEETPPPIMPGWAEAVDPESGDVYYYHKVSKKTTWDRPVANSDASQKSDESDDAASDDEDDDHHEDEADAENDQEPDTVRQDDNHDDGDENVEDLVQGFEAEESSEQEVRFYVTLQRFLLILSFYPNI